jgi:hypothetical protein
LAHIFKKLFQKLYKLVLEYDGLIRQH